MILFDPFISPSPLKTLSALQAEEEAGGQRSEQCSHKLRSAFAGSHQKPGPDSPLVFPEGKQSCQISDFWLPEP